MTKREICERLMKIRDYVRDTDTWPHNPHNSVEQRNLTLHNAVAVIAKDLRDLLLDLAAPEEAKEEEKVEAPKGKRPPVVIYNDADEKRPCPQCGQLCPEDLVSGRYFCRTHGSFKPKEGNAPSRGIKEQFLALGEKAIKRIDFGKVADAEWEICSDSRERMFSWARGAIEGAVSKVIAGGEEAEFVCGCLDAKASRKHGRLRIELNHRRTKQYVEVDELESEEGE